MLSVYVHCLNEYDAKQMTDLLSDTLTGLGGEQISSIVRWKGGCRKDEQIGPINIAIVEVSDEYDFEELLTFRKKYPCTKLLILNRGEIEPEKYIRPDLYPCALLSSPPDPGDLKDTFEQIIRQIYQDRERGRADQRLVVRYGRERFLVPFSSIYYIEAKEKWIHLHLDSGVISFRDSLKHLEQILPDYYMRTHRGVIVNFLHVRAVDPDAGMIRMTNNTVIPMSRFFRQLIEKKLGSKRTL